MIQLSGQWVPGYYWNSWVGSVRLIRQIGNNRIEG
jgi:hypothetical protein